MSESQSHSPKEHEEVGAHSGDEQEHMDKDQQDGAGQGQGEFEVKEQDRWLPIANGKLLPLAACP